MLLKFTKGEEYGDELDSLPASVVKDNLDHDKLERHLSIWLVLFMRNYYKLRKLPAFRPYKALSLFGVPSFNHSDHT